MDWADYRIDRTMIAIPSAERFSISAELAPTDGRSSKSRDHKGTLIFPTCMLSDSLINSFYSVEHVCQRHMSRIEPIISLLQRNHLLPPPFVPFHCLNAELPETTGDGSPDTFPTKYPEALTAGLERIRLSAHHNSLNPGMGGACDGDHAGNCLQQEMEFKYVESRF